MKQIKVSEASGIVLDYLVAKCKGFDYMKAEGQRARTNKGRPFWMETPRYHPHNDWSQGGLIIEREGIRWNKAGDLFYAWTPDHPWIDPLHEPQEDCDRIQWRGFAYGPTLLIAALRCYVASKLGETAEVPEELT